MKKEEELCQFNRKDINEQLKSDRRIIHKSHRYFFKDYWTRKLFNILMDYIDNKIIFRIKYLHTKYYNHLKHIEEYMIKRTETQMMDVKTFSDRIVNVESTMRYNYDDIQEIKAKLEEIEKIIASNKNV